MPQAILITLSSSLPNNSAVANVKIGLILFPPPKTL